MKEIISDMIIKIAQCFIKIFQGKAYLKISYISMPCEINRKTLNALSSGIVVEVTDVT